jgi:hypothetical protein
LGLVNIPMSHPQRKLPGYQITWPLSNTLRYCEPPALLGELAQAGAHFQSDLATMYRGEPDYIETALQNIEARVRSITQLLRNQPVDLVMLVLTEVDRVCHHYWHYADPAHPKHVESPPPGQRRSSARTRRSIALWRTCCRSCRTTARSWSSPTMDSGRAASRLPCTAISRGGLAGHWRR